MHFYNQKLDFHQRILNVLENINSSGSHKKSHETFT